MIYIFYLLLLVLLLMTERKQPSGRNLIRAIIPLVYIALIGLRGANVGMDTPVYYQHYYQFGQDGCDYIERGFDLLNQFCYHNGWNHVPFFCICAAFAIIPVAISINSRLSRNDYTWFMLLFCTTTFSSLCNGMRQNMACGIYFWCLMYTEFGSKGFLKGLVYLAGIGLSALFHVSILIVAPLFIVKYIKLPRSGYIILYLTSFLFVFFNVADILTSYFPVLELGGRDYTHYMDSELTHSSASSLGFIITSIRNFLVLILLFRINAFEKYPLLSNLAFLFYLLTNLGFNVPLVGRINMYFAFVDTLMVALILSKYFEGSLSRVKLYVQSLVIILLLLVGHGFISKSSKVREYTFFWETPNYERYIE